MIIWTHEKLFWQGCRKIFATTTGNKTENLERKYNEFLSSLIKYTSQIAPGQVQSSFGNLRKRFLLIVQQISAQSLKPIETQKEQETGFPQTVSLLRGLQF